MKFMLWTREDRNKDNPISVTLYDGDICVSGKWLTILDGDKKTSVLLKDVLMVDFDLKDYKVERSD